jgi:hypothetical protein
MQSIGAHKLEWVDEDGEIKARLNGELYTGITTWRVGPQYREQSLVNSMLHGRQWAFEESDNLMLWEEWFEHGVPVGRHFRWVDFRTRKRTTEYENRIVQRALLENKWGNKLQEYDRKAREIREWHLNGTLRSARKFVDPDQPYSYSEQTFWASDATWLLTIKTDAPDEFNREYLQTQWKELDDSYDTEFVVARYARTLIAEDLTPLLRFLDALRHHNSSVYKLLVVRMLERMEDDRALAILKEIDQRRLIVSRLPRNNSLRDEQYRLPRPHQRRIHRRPRPKPGEELSSD